MIAAALSKPSRNEDSDSDQDEEGLRSSQEEDATRSSLQWGCNTQGGAPSVPPSSPVPTSEFGMVLIDVRQLPVATHVPAVEVADASCSPMAVSAPACSSAFPFPGLIKAERSTPGTLSDLPPLGATRKFVMPAFQANRRFAVGCRLRRKPRFSRAGFIKFVNRLVAAYMEGVDDPCGTGFLVEHGDGAVNVLVTDEGLKTLEGTYYEGVQGRRFATFLYSYEHLKVAVREMPERGEARAISWHAAEHLFYPRTMHTGYYVNLRECLMPRSTAGDAYVYGWECEAYDGYHWLLPEPFYPEIIENSFCSEGNIKRWSRVAPVTVARYRNDEKVTDEEFKAEMVHYVATTKANNAAKLARAMAVSKARAAAEADEALIASMD